MDNILGLWKLKKNNNFNKFLVFTHTPWYVRLIAEHASIDVSIVKKSNGYLKKIESAFYNSEEFIILDNTFRKYDYGVLKKYTLENNVIDTDIKGTIVNWNEKIYRQDDSLIIEFSWLEDEELKFATQDFSK